MNIFYGLNVNMDIKFSLELMTQEVSIKDYLLVYIVITVKCGSSTGFVQLYIR